MAIAEDIEKIIEQEKGLAFPEFDEHVAFAVAAIIRERAVNEKLGLAAEIRLWDRPLCFFAMPGTTADNAHWIRRKSNVVQRLLKASYRAKLEAGGTERMFAPHRDLPVDEFALSGGGFPIRVKGVGIIGAATASGLHERDDHDVVVAAICEYLGIDCAAFALAPRTP